MLRLLQKLINYLNPKINESVTRDIDRQSIRNVYYISLFAIAFELLSIVLFLIVRIGSIDQEAATSLILVACCVLLCFVSALISVKILRNRDLQHKYYVLFKVVFYVAFSVWAVFADFRHYRAGEQMLTFFTVTLISVSFVMLRPLIGILTVGGVFGFQYILLLSFDGAARIQPMNYWILALISIAVNMITFHNQIYVFSKSYRLSRSNQDLEESSRRDGLTLLWNRLALEADADKMDGRPMTIYMMDINYFKEINDRYGHIAGDTVLKEVSAILKEMFPGARYYRYGGDEFLVVTYKPAEQNYGGQSYSFDEKLHGIRVSLSIGSAKGEPANYQEFFDLVSSADKALYVVKGRTHSAEYGGHDRRKRQES